MKNIFKIDPATLEPQPFNVFRKIIITTAIVSTVLSSIFLYIGYSLGSDVLTGLSEEEKLVIIQEHNQFSEDRLIDKLKELNVNNISDLKPYFKCIGVNFNIELIFISF